MVSSSSMVTTRSRTLIVNRVDRLTTNVQRCDVDHCQFLTCAEPDEFSLISIQFKPILRHPFGYVEDTLVGKWLPSAGQLQRSWHMSANHLHKRECRHHVPPCSPQSLIHPQYRGRTTKDPVRIPVGRHTPTSEELRYCQQTQRPESCQLGTS